MGLAVVTKVLYRRAFTMINGKFAPGGWWFNDFLTLLEDNVAK